MVLKFFCKFSVMYGELCNGSVVGKGTEHRTRM